MLKILSAWARMGLSPTTRTRPTRGRSSDLPSQSNVRALATGAALAVSLDTSPAVLVTLYDYAHHYRDRPRRRPDGRLADLVSLRCGSHV